MICILFPPDADESGPRTRYEVSLTANATKKIAPNVASLFLSGKSNFPSGLVPSGDRNFTNKK